MGRETSLFSSQKPPKMCAIAKKTAAICAIQTKMDEKFVRVYNFQKRS